MAENGRQSLRQRLRRSQWQEVEEYRALLEPAEQFESGFTMRTIIGVLFISLVMTPGEMYLGLVTGGGVYATDRESEIKVDDLLDRIRQAKRN